MEIGDSVIIIGSSWAPNESIGVIEKDPDTTMPGVRLDNGEFYWIERDNIRVIIPPNIVEENKYFILAKEEEELLL